MSGIGCLTGERLVLYLEDRMEAEERQLAEDHLSRCGPCRRQLVQVHASRREEAVTLRAPERLKRKARRIPRRRSSRPPRLAGAFRWQAALATVAVVALGLGIYFTAGVARPPEVPDGERLRASPPGPAGLVGLAPEDDAAVAGGQIVFRWSEVDQVERYTLSVLDDLGNIVFREETRDAERAVELEELPPNGRACYWYVTAKLGDGTSMDSEIRRFIVGFESP